MTSAEERMWGWGGGWRWEEDGEGALRENNRHEHGVMYFKDVIIYPRYKH